MNQTLTIRIPDDLREGLLELSKSENKPVSDIVRNLWSQVLNYKFLSASADTIGTN